MSESHFAAEPGILWVSLMAGPPPPDPWGMGVGGKDQHPPGRRWSAGASVTQGRDARDPGFSNDCSQPIRCNLMDGPLGKMWSKDRPPAAATESSL